MNGARIVVPHPRRVRCPSPVCPGPLHSHLELGGSASKLCSWTKLPHRSLPKVQFGVAAEAWRRKTSKMPRSTLEACHTGMSAAAAIRAMSRKPQSEGATLIPSTASRYTISITWRGFCRWGAMRIDVSSLSRR